jgi:hypothetical protein
MTTYSKTVYIEVEAADEDEAVDLIDRATSPLVMDEASPITYVDLDGPIEEAAS